MVKLQRITTRRRRAGASSRGRCCSSYESLPLVIVMVVAAFWMGRRSSPVAETRTTTADLLPHLPTCDKPQSPLSLPQLARLYQPSKFWGYAHTNYDRVYPHYLEAYRGKHFRMLEIGLSTGQGSLLWQAYFPCATLYGLEVVTSNTNTTGAAAISTIQGDQGDRAFLEGDFLQRAHGGHFDVIIDDGGHHYEQQVTSYQVLFDQALSPGGIYVIEDIETSYWKTGQDLYGQPVTRGGQSEAETVVNKFKQLVDVVNKKFFDNTYTVFGPVDYWVATVTFMSNLIILTKKDLSHCLAELAYIWPGNLAEDCPAQHQPVEAGAQSPLVKYCGERIVRRDAWMLQSEWET